MSAVAAVALEHIRPGDTEPSGKKLFFLCVLIFKTVEKKRGGPLDILLREQMSVFAFYYTPYSIYLAIQALGGSWDDRRMSR